MISRIKTLEDYFNYLVELPMDILKFNLKFYL